MRLTEISYDTAPPVDGYGPGFFRIGGEKREGGQLLLPNKVIDWGGYGDLEKILEVAGDLDVLFVGTGAEIAHVPAAFRTSIEQAGPGLEVMASPPACRTYNVLLSEGRRIGAALLPV